MCYGNLDPKIALRDIDDRVKAPVLQGHKEPEPVPGLIGRAVALFARFRQKEATHV